MSDPTAMTAALNETRPVAERMSAAIRVYQKLRDDRGLPVEIAFAGIAHAIVWLAEERLMASHDKGELAGILKDIRTVEEAHGLKPGEYWERGAGPTEWQELQDDYEHACAQITADLMSEMGENEMADLYLDDPEEFDHRCKAARR